MQAAGMTGSAGSTRVGPAIALCLLAATGCGSASVADAGNARARTCGSQPKQLVAKTTYIPSDAGGLGIQVPVLGVNATDLFYLLNIDTPLSPALPSGAVEGQLWRVPLGGGPPIQLVVTPGGNGGGGQSLAVTDAGAIFSTDPQGAYEGTPSVLMTIGPEGGAPKVLATAVGRIGPIVTDGVNAYFADYGEGIKRVSLTGGPVTVLSSSSVAAMSVSGGRLYVADANLPADVLSIPVEGGREEIIAQNLSAAWDPMVCGTAVCWLSEVGSFDWGLFRLNPDAGAPDLLAHGIMEPLTMLFDGKYFFVTSGGGGLQIWRISAASGALDAPVIGGGINGLAMDDSCVYWSSSDGIYSVAREVLDTQ